MTGRLQRMAGRGRPPKYPWDTWLNGEQKLLLPGRDFDPRVEVRSLQMQLLAKARERELDVRTERFGTGLSVVFAKRSGIDWDKVFDGELHVFVPGVDFVADEGWRLQEEMLAESRRRGVRLPIKVMEDGRIGCVADIGQLQRRAATMPAPSETPGEVDTERVGS